METPTILITDAQSRQALAAARSLRRAGLRVFVTDTERLTLAGCSRFVSRSFVTPDPRTQEDSFVRAVYDIAQTHQCSMVLPMTDRSLVALARHAQELPPSLICPFPALDTIMAARDKSRAIDVARTLGIAVPATILIRSEMDLASVTSFPILLKPVQGSGSRGIRIASTLEELHRIAPQTLANFGPLLAQEIIPREGEEIGCYALCDGESTVVASILQRRLRSFPVSGGPSTLRVTMHDDQIVRESTRLLKAIGWRGPAMVEWKMDPRSGKPVLMEINPRFWGSLEGTIASGIDFPLLTYHTFTGAPPTTPPVYRDGIETRWLFPGDLLWLIKSGPSPRRIASFLAAFRAHDDIWSLRDPLPFLGSFLIALLHFVHPAHRAYFLKR